MKIIEASFSLIFFLMFANTILLNYDSSSINSVQYRYALLNDVWRVLYLRGDFHNFDTLSLNTARDRAEEDMTKITELTGLCINLSGVRVQSRQCRSDEIYNNSMTIQKRMFVGSEVKEVSLTISPH